MNPTEIRELFDRAGVLQTGHFELSSGMHSDVYLQCQRVLEHPRLTRSLGTALASRFPEGSDVVLSPAVGALPIGFAVADALDCRFVFSERRSGVMALRRGQRIHRGERVVVVEDVITTGGSAAECVALANAAGATVGGVASLVDRSQTPPGFRLESLIRVEATAYDPAGCPLCARGLPIDSPGSRTLTP